jgi:hypothetical protein
LYGELKGIKEEYVAKMEKKKNPENKKVFIEDVEEEDEEDPEPKYNYCVIIDDFADALKDNNIIKQKH